MIVAIVMSLTYGNDVLITFIALILRSVSAMFVVDKSLFIT